MLFAFMLFLHVFVCLSFPLFEIFITKITLYFVFLKKSLNLNHFIQMHINVLVANGYFDKIQFRFFNKICYSQFLVLNLLNKQRFPT